MNKKEEIAQLFDGLRKVLFYVGHGKYNDYMTTDEVEAIKSTLEKILEHEQAFEQASSDEQINAIYDKVCIYKDYSVKDFIELGIKPQ